MMTLWSRFFGARARIYLDHAAATPLASEAVAAMASVAHLFANPSAIHREGVAARQCLEVARGELARQLAIRPAGVVFTGSGTESNNLALYGVVRARHQTGVAYRDMVIISTELEHPSVRAVLDDLAEWGVQVVFVAVDEEGLIDETHLAKLLSPQVVLVSFAYVNSEIGVVQEVGRLTRLVKKYNQSHHTTIYVHTDAAQAPLWLPCQLDRLGVDLISLDVGKCGGPKGVGVLAFRHGVQLTGVIRGGGQEGGLRAATENVVGIVGAVAALTRAQQTWEARSERVGTLRDETMAQLMSIEGVVLNGARTQRVANNINISISGVDGEFAVVSLDEAGFAISTKSACSGAGGGGSTVVRTISGDAARAATTLRITLGESTTAAELAQFVAALRLHIEKTRHAQAFLTR